MTTAAIVEVDPAARRVLLRRASGVLLLCVGGGAAGQLMKPDQEIATFAGVKLEAAVPSAFGDWRIDPYTRPVIPDPSTLAALTRIYHETLARTYINSRGERIMLSLAYGRRQNDSMRLHQPEGCYTGQGFGVRVIGQINVGNGAASFPVTRLHATLGARQEPVTYWMVIGGRHAVTQTEMKLAQLRFGLRGYLPDGLLFRVSSINPDSNAGFSLQDQFIQQLLAAVTPVVRDGLVGAVA